MADNTATQRRSSTDAVTGNGIAGSIKSLVATVELAASASGDTIDFGKIPSKARILPSSTLYWDDLATSGTATVDLGLKSYTGSGNSVTADPDAIGNGFDVHTSASSGSALSDHANSGLPAWDLINGVTSDPGGSFEVYGTVKDAATTATGTVTLNLQYIVD